MLRLVTRKYRAKNDNVKQLLVDDMPMSVLKSTHLRLSEEIGKAAIHRRLNNKEDDRDEEEFEVFHES